MGQEIKYINIKKLVLWTENPRDPIDENAIDQDVVDRALEDRSSKWSLSKLAKEMGDFYDFSELPTVVYHNNKPVVYDGNRRVILGKIKNGFVTIPKNKKIMIPEFPEEIPCNICSQKVALNNVLRKHGDTGSWKPLERDIFLYKFMGEEKSPLLILEEDTGIISENPHLNQRFVKEEIFSEDGLNFLGFNCKEGRLNTIHSDEEAYLVLNDVSNKIKDKVISTRKNRGKIDEVLEPDSQRLIDKNINNKARLSNIKFDNKEEMKKQPRQTHRIPKINNQLFGGKLYLQKGLVSNMYRDIVDLYEFYLSKKNELSETFPGLIRMSLRLICEAAAKDNNNKKIDNYLNDHFEAAKKTLGKDIRTTLKNYNVRKESIVQLLHTGAHNYESSTNVEQTIAMSIIIGSILTISHGKKV